MISILPILALPLIASAVSAESLRLKQRQTVEKVVNPRPSLNEAAFFTILTKTGVAVVPTVEIYGNLGVAPVAISYYTGLSVQITSDFDHATAAQVNNGFLYAGDSSNSPPASSSHAVDAMMDTFDSIMGLKGSAEPEKAGGILDGLVLTEGLYTWSTAVALHAGQTLTLVGDNKSVFVFQSAGEFTFETASRMILGGEGENAVLAANIFFATATSFTTGAETKIFGNILTGTNVVLGDNCVLVGGVYSQTELAIAKGVIITSSSPYCTYDKPATCCNQHLKQLAPGATSPPSKGLSYIKPE